MQEYLSGLPCPPPGDLPKPGIKSMSLMSPALAGGFFTTEPPGKPNMMPVCTKSIADLKELKGSAVFQLNLPLPESPRVELLGLQSADKWKRKIQPGLEEI